MGIEIILGNLPQEQGCASLIPVMSLVAHLKGLGNHNLHVNFTVKLKGLLINRIILIPQPYQAIKYFLVSGAEPQHLS